MQRRTTKILTGGLLAAVILGGGAVPAGATVASEAAPTSVSAAGVNAILDKVESAAHKLRDVIATLRSTTKTAEQKRTSARGPSALWSPLRRRSGDRRRPRSGDPADRDTHCRTA